MNKIVTISPIPLIPELMSKILDSVSKIVSKIPESMSNIPESMIKL